MNLRLQDKVAVITGAGNGIGLETALTFAREGARVAVAEFDASAGEAAALRIREGGGDAAFFPVDVSDWDSVQALAAAVAERYGRIDVLVNNAGITQDAMLSKMTVEQWRKVIDVNLDGVFYCTKAFAPYMVQQGKGKIINTSSVVGVHGNIGQTNYAATKAGVIGMTKTWAKELGFKGVNVNAVAPGYIETGMVAKVPEKVLAAMVERVPLRRLGRPADVANAYLFLASDEADYVNGTVLEVDGGLVI